jgi:hypothetical protein
MHLRATFHALSLEGKKLTLLLDESKYAAVSCQDRTCRRSLPMRTCYRPRDKTRQDSERALEPPAVGPPESSGLGELFVRAGEPSSTVRTARCTFVRNPAIPAARRTGCTALVSSTTAASSAGAMSIEVPVKPVCQIVPAGQLPHWSGRTRQPSTRASGSAPACLLVISAIVAADKTG